MRPTGWNGRADDDVLERLLMETRRPGGMDPRALAALHEELARQFIASPEGASVARPQACLVLMTMAAEILDVTLVTMRPAHLRDVLYRLVPLHVDVPARDARKLLAVTRAFFAFLGRAHGLATADDLLPVAADESTRELSAALADETRFSAVKKALLDGKKAGHDVKTEEGQRAVLRRWERRGRRHRVTG